MMRTMSLAGLLVGLGILIWSLILSVGLGAPTPKSLAGTSGGGGPVASLLGDVNDDGRVTDVDVALVLQFEAGEINLPNPANGDVNQDGTIDSIDVHLILQRTVGLVPPFPITPLPTPLEPPYRPVVHINSGAAQPGDGVTVQLLIQTSDTSTSSKVGAWVIDVLYDPSILTSESCAPTRGFCNTAFADDIVRIVGAYAPGYGGEVSAAELSFTCTNGSYGLSGSLTLSVPMIVTSEPTNPRRMDPIVESGKITCAFPTPTPNRTPLAATPTPFTQRPGDANCDGRVNSVDAAVILQYVARSVSSIPCLQNVDVDEDGGVSPIDALLVLQFVAGFLHDLPV